MSLDRFIFCPCGHALEVHGPAGCQTCPCSAGQRAVVDRLLEAEREEIHRTWLGPARPDSRSTLSAS